MMMTVKECQLKRFAVSAAMVVALLTPVKSVHAKRIIKELCQDCIPNHVLAAVEKASIKHHVSTKLILAVIHVESKFSSKASNRGNIGLMQVNSKYHRSKFHGVSMYSIPANIDIGTGILKECLVKHHEIVRKALVCYNGNGDAKYVSKVNKSIYQYKHKRTSTL